MPTQHTIQSGDCISSLGFEYGFFPETIWNDPANADLRTLRRDMNILCPGDVVVIPDKKPKEVPKPSDETHSFLRRGVPEVLRIRLIDDNDQVLADEPYTLTVDGESSNGTTDSAGMLVESIPPGADRAVVTLQNHDLTMELPLGHLEPIETIAGIKARLNNLEFFCGEVDDELDADTRTALKAFQAKYELEKTGQPDRPTRDKLKEVHGS